MYATDHNFPGMLYGVPVEATIASGRSKSSTERRRRKCLVCARFFIGQTLERFPVLQPGEGFERICVERRPPFETMSFRYYGQYVALAVADTFEVAKSCRGCCPCHLRQAKANVEADLQLTMTRRRNRTTYGPVKRLQSERGDPNAFAKQRSKLIKLTPHHPKRITRLSCRRDSNMDATN